MDDPEGPAPQADDEQTDPRESAYELLSRGRAFLATRHPAQAAVVLQRAAALEPGKGSILEPLGRAYFMSSQLDRAVETFLILLDGDPTSHFAHYALGRSYLRLGRTQEARTHFRLAVALAPSSRLYRSALERIDASGKRIARDGPPAGGDPGPA